MKKVYNLGACLEVCRIMYLLSNFVIFENLSVFEVIKLFHAQLN